MSTIYTHQSANIRTTWLLFAAFLVLVIGLGWIFSSIYNDQTILWFAVVFSLVMNVGSYWYSDKLVLAVSGAKPADPMLHRDLIRTVENLSITAGLPMPKVYVVEDPAPNAFATGRNKEHAVVAATTGLLAVLETSELEGVIAHELSHVGNRDILVSTVAVVLAGFVSLMADFFLRSIRFRSNDRDNKGGGILVIIGVVLAILAPIFASLMRLAISRKREYLADASGALLTRYPEGLARALEKIAAYNAPVARASSATAHLYFANPFGAGKRNFLNLLATHPPIEDRIRILRGM